MISNAAPTIRAVLHREVAPASRHRHVQALVCLDIAQDPVTYSAVLAVEVVALLVPVCPAVAATAMANHLDLQIKLLEN